MKTLLSVTLLGLSLYGAYLWATIIGVAGGLVGLVFLVKQVNAAKHAAEAAKVSADTFVHSERAWIMVDVDFLCGPQFGSRVLNGVETEQTAIQIRLIYWNDGKTPAWITGKLFVARVVDQIPDRPDLENWKPGDFFDISLEPLGVGKEQKSPAYWLECDGRLTDKNILVLYGYVHYRDIFSPTRETRYGYTLLGGKNPTRIQAHKTLWEYNSYS